MTTRAIPTRLSALPPNWTRPCTTCGQTFTRTNIRITRCQPCRINKRYPNEKKARLLASSELTERELEMCQLLLVHEGDYKAVAAAAYISLTTVKSHFDRIFAKLQVTSKVGLLLKLIRTGQVPL